jgi:hypothetical protein
MDPRVIEQVATDISLGAVAENFTRGQASHGPAKDSKRGRGNR